MRGVIKWRWITPKTKCPHCGKWLSLTVNIANVRTSKATGKVSVGTSESTDPLPATAAASETD